MSRDRLPCLSRPANEIVRTDSSAGQSSCFEKEGLLSNEEFFPVTYVQSISASVFHIITAYLKGNCNTAMLRVPLND